MISNELHKVFNVALDYAKKQHHEYLTIEHVFLSILQSDAGRELLTLLGANVDKMSKDIANYISNHVDVVPYNSYNYDKTPVETVTLSNTINKMLKQIQAAGRKEATIGNMLVAIREQDNSHASYLMEKAGISAVDIMKIISHPSEVKKRKTGSVDLNSNKEKDKSFLEEFTIELVKFAKEGKIDPVTWTRG